VGPGARGPTGPTLNPALALGKVHTNFGLHPFVFELGARTGQTDIRTDGQTDEEE